MTAFGLGELPGTSMEEAADIVASESPLPHIPQLPERGLGSDLIGRTAALLPIHVDRGPRSWKVTPRPQIWTRRARDRFERDLDLLEELWVGKHEQVKVQVVGPWTLAAELEMGNGHRMLSDRGALYDLTEALKETLIGHVRDVKKRLGAEVVVQLDEPRLGEVIAGTVRGTTDFDEIPAVHEDDVLQRLEEFGAVLLNSPTPLFNAEWITVELEKLHGTAQLDHVGAHLGSGRRLAIAPTEPRKVGELLDLLQVDPTQADIDVYAPVAAALKETAHNYARARECSEILERDFLS